MSCLPNLNRASALNQRASTHHRQAHRGCPHPTTGIGSPTAPERQCESTDACVPSALQLIPPRERRTTRTVTRARGRTSRISPPSRSRTRSGAAGGNLTAAAEKLKVARIDALPATSMRAVAARDQGRDRREFVDKAEAVIVAAVRRGDVNAATFVLRTQGHRRGWSTLARASGGRADAGAAASPQVDMTAALKALSPDEMMALQAIVAKLEASARLEERDASERDADDDGSRRCFQTETFPGRGRRSARSTRSRRSPHPTRLI